MFLRMLKKDLMSKKGLNIILFIFILAASVLVFISSDLIYIGVTGSAEAKKLYKKSDAVVLFNSSENEREKNNQEAVSIIESDPAISYYYHQECLRISDRLIDISDFSKDKGADKMFINFCITKQPHDHDLLYDQNNMPFYVKNGEIALSYRFKFEFGANEGDKFRIISPLGYVYEFTISHFYKDYDNIFSRLVLSDADYDVIRTKNFTISDYYYLKAKDDSPTNLMLWADKMFDQYKYRAAIYLLDNEMNTYTVVADLVSFFLALLSAFMILLILLTIRFTVIAELKEQEKEIGIMRAVGVDSLKFRWLFCAKYIGFSVIGGVIGVAVGFPATKYLGDLLFKQVPIPNDIILLTMGVSAVLGIILFTIIFALFSMRKMKTISIMTAIHGETLGENFSAKHSPSLRSSKSVPVPLFLAVSDITSNIRRYIFLILTYTLCVAIILLTVYMRFSIENKNFLKYSFVTRADFYVDYSLLSEKMQDTYDERSRYENLSIEQLINEDLRDNNIPAHFELDLSDNCSFRTSDGKNNESIVYFYMNDAASLQYHSGRAPVLSNEIAITYHTAKKMKITPGSVIEIDIPTSYNEHEQFKKEQFVVTGLIDAMEMGLPVFIMSPGYDPFENEDYRSSFYAAVIDSDNKEEVISQIKELYGNDAVYNEKLFIDDYLVLFAPVIDFIMYSFSISVVIISVLITILYLNIFITEDRHEISLLMNIGFSDKTIRNWQALKILILSGISIIAGILLTSTLGLKLAQICCENLVSLTGFRFISMPFFTFVAVPVIFCTAIIIPSFILLRKIRNIDLRNTNEEM